MRKERMMKKKMSITDSSDSTKCRISLLMRCIALRNTVGGAMVELALVVPIFTTLLVGAAEFARVAYASIEVSNAARAGVAYGSQSSSTASDLTGMQTAATNDGGNVSGLSATASQFWACSSSTVPYVQLSSPPTCTGTGNHLLNYVQVTTTATVNPLVHLPGLPATYTLRGLAIMRVL
jgi:Flp pilus assembly protein TadG